MELEVSGLPGGWQGRVLPARSIPLLQKAEKQQGTIVGMGWVEAGLGCWPAGGVRLRPSGLNQGQALLKVARQPGPGPRTTAQTRLKRAGLLLQQSQALLPQQGQTLWAGECQVNAEL